MTKATILLSISGALAGGVLSTALGCVTKDAPGAASVGDAGPEGDPDAAAGSPGEDDGDGGSTNGGSENADAADVPAPCHVTKPFGTPVMLASLGSTPTEGEYAACPTDDELTIFFVKTPGATPMVAKRTALGAAFDAPKAPTRRSTTAPEHR